MPSNTGSTIKRHKKEGALGKSMTAASLLMWEVDGSIRETLHYVINRPSHFMIDKGIEITTERTAVLRSSSGSLLGIKEGWRRDPAAGCRTANEELFFCLSLRR